MYHHKKIEKKWQKIWSDQKTYKTSVDSSKPKYYILDMFPYPSGSGLHVGHVTGYTATDILARYMRNKGYNVLHPIGWDSFGLPAEQYAIRTGTHPQETTEKNISTYKTQLQSLGFSYDWDRELATSDEKYYKWTQWIFTKLYEKGLAYEASIPVNFCPELGTVLANEEVEDGKAKEGGFLVERRPLRQWVLKITAYAERLLEDLEELDWPEHLKRLQRNWIGKSEGCQIVFTEEKTKEKLEAFTTRPDTIFGISYLAIAPEHPLVKVITPDTHKKSVEAYQKASLQKSDLERKDASQEKTGVFTGAFVTHPVTLEKIPLWVADYVLSDYGSGVVMGVPCSDARDFAFAKVYNLPILPIYEPVEKHTPEGEDFAEFQKKVLSGSVCYEAEGILCNSSSSELQLNGLKTSQAKKAVESFLTEKGKGKKTTHYKLRDWLFSRQRYWGEPIPIVHLENGEKRSLDLDELPLTAPDMQDFKPTPDGKSPLERNPEWCELIDSKTGIKARRETNTMPQWAGSCWYYLRFLDPLNDEEAWSKEKENYWMPVDLYVGGAEHAVLHLLYARFWHKVLYDLQLVHTKEPFKVYRNQGLVTSRSYRKKGGLYVPEEQVEQKGSNYFDKRTGEPLLSQIEKMSKSKLNGVLPDEMIEEFGADTLRLYEMFMGPFDKDKIWNREAVTGCYRFLCRFYEMISSKKVVDESEEKAFELAHKTANLVRRDIESMQFNTAIAHMMAFLNDFIPLPAYPKKALLLVVQALYPFAPHAASEMWEILGEKELSYAPLLPIEKKYLETREVTYVIQVNGKVRANLTLEKGREKEEIIEHAKTHENVKKHLLGDVVKTIFVPNKLLNIVVKSKGS